jgi:hypothetical protein
VQLRDEGDALNHRPKRSRRSGKWQAEGWELISCFGVPYRIDALMNSVNNENPIASFRYGLYAIRGLGIDYASAGK